MPPLKEIVFSDEEAKSVFTKPYGTDLNQVAKDNLLGQLSGVWEIVRPTAEVSILGCIPLDEFGEIYLRPKSGKCRNKYLVNISAQLIRAVSLRISEIYGESGFDGSFEEYDWLLENYGVTEQEDNSWLDILYQHQGVLEESGTLDDLDEPYRQQQIEFLADKEACLKFLFELHLKYSSSKKKHPKTSKAGRKRN